MSNFNPNSKILKPEEWRTLAAKNVIKEADSASRDFVISALLGLVAAGLTGMMPVGVGIVGCGILRGWRKNNLMDKRIKAIQMGCAAPFLDDTQLRRFTKQAGIGEVLKQIHWASEEDLDVLPSAEDFYEIHGASMALPECEAEAAIEVPAVTVTETVGNATRLGAIEVPATAVNFADTHGGKDDDIVDLLLGQGNSLAFFGAQRSGKSRLMAIASQEGVKRGKFKHVTVLSGLAKQDEDPEYWHHSSAKGFYDLAPMTRKEVDRVLSDWLQKINNFRQSANVENAGLLIIDEYVYLASRCASSPVGSIAHSLSQAIIEVVTVVESGGAKRGWHLWIGCPSCAVSGMGDMGKAMKKLQLVYCAIAKGETVNAKGIEVSWNAELFEAVKINYKSLQEPQGCEAALQGRIVFFNDKWMPQTSLSLGSQPQVEQEEQEVKPDDKEVAKVAAMVQALYQSKAKEHPNMNAEFLNLAAQVKALKEAGHQQKAFAVMIAPIGKSKTAFCQNLGVTGGTEFQKLSAVYDWAQAK